MVNVDKSFPVFTIGFFEIESTGLTDGSMMSNAGYGLNSKSIETMKQEPPMSALLLSLKTQRQNVKGSQDQTPG